MLNQIRSAWREIQGQFFGSRMNWRQRTIALMMIALITPIAACSLPQVNAEDRLFLPLSAELVGSLNLDTDTFQNTEVGGLSGIVYDGQKDLFYAISDDRSERGPARFYTLEMKLGGDAQKPTFEQMNLVSVTTIKDEQGQEFANKTIDPEGIAIASANSVFISTEGVTNRGIPPFIGEFDLQTGRRIRQLPIPETYLPDGPAPTQKKGIRDNLGFESLTSTVGGNSAEPFRVFTAVEGPLAQDLATPSAQPNPRNRVLHYLIEGKRATVISEHAYPLEDKPRSALDLGLSEITSIDQGGHFLSLERSFGLNGFQVKLFQFVTGTATDTSTIESLRDADDRVQPIRKRLLLDLSDLGITIDNLEGMTLGPRLPDGTQSLMLVSDDNFSKFSQVTQFILLRIKGLKS